LIYFNACFNACKDKQNLEERGGIIIQKQILFTNLKGFYDKKPRHHVEAFEFLNVSAVCVFM
jgi:hypothetical protein